MKPNRLAGAAMILVFVAGCSVRNPSSTATNPPPAPSVQVAGDRNTIPAGTRFAVRTNQTIETKDAGGSYSAEVAQDIMNSNGSLLIPKGSSAELEVVRARSGGTVGTPALELAIQAVTVNGKRYLVTTGRETASGDEGIGANRRTAIITGGGAVLGTLLGAALGGAKGAAIGAAVGAAGGATAQVLTRGEEIRIPAETVLTFQLDQPLALQG